jgi:DNA adenine methylase
MSTTINSKAIMSRPFVKWVGGKARLLGQISEYYPHEFGTFYEPFVGGGAMYFSLNPDKAHINDLNKTLAGVYINIKSDVEKLINELADLQSFYWSLEDLDKKKQLFLEKRSLFNELPSVDFEKAVLFIFLNKTCFNGMYRENSKGSFNVPFGKHDKPTICDEANLRRIATTLGNTKITSTSYEIAVENAKAGDFIYFDPPYHPLNPTSSFTSYQAGGFSAQDQEKLRDKFRELSDRGCKVMLSNSDSPLINELYKDFNIHKIFAARSINSVGSKRGKIAEVLVTNY